ncbi:Cc8l18.2-like protein [Plakobranchus ocellatus]|uniref:Cc8l18.2-like protein n=1 Tax=Plakobranchus ocellatus TaxID=259542 RepID=A0AAV4D185_9GAST|nr:Cc8l18.2-like protein [Plakobranchus ocellatus]
MFAKILQYEVVWQYFATSHGKGVVDGIGGAAQSAVRRVQSKTSPVMQCAKVLLDFVRYDLQNMKAVRVLEREIGQNESRSIWKDVQNMYPGKPFGSTVKKYRNCKT